MNKYFTALIIIFFGSLGYGYFLLQKGDVNVKSDHSYNPKTIEETITTRGEITELNSEKFNLNQNSQKTQEIQNINPQPEESTSSSAERTSSQKNTRVEDQDPLLVEYEKNSKCEVFFYYKSDDEIDDMLIDLGNVGAINTQLDLKTTESLLKNRIADCERRIDSRTHSDFLKYNQKILRSSAEKGNSISQLRLATLLQQQSANKAGLTPTEKSELYREHIQWLTRSSKNGNAEAKIFLALAYLDPINYPEEFNLEEASLLADEAGRLLGKDLKHLKDIIDSF